MKNLMGKSRGKSEPYAIFKGIGVFGTTEVSLLKVYEKPALEVSNDYALWSVAIKTEETYETYDEGDVYVGEVVDG